MRFAEAGEDGRKEEGEKGKNVSGTGKVMIFIISILECLINNSTNFILVRNNSTNSFNLNSKSMD